MNPYWDTSHLKKHLLCEPGRAIYQVPTSAKQGPPRPKLGPGNQCCCEGQAVGTITELSSGGTFTNL